MDETSLSTLQVLTDDIKHRLYAASENFVAIGYRLRQIKESGEFAGAADIFEYAQKEFGMSKSATSRFMAINEKYSVDGNGLELKEEYKVYKYSQLQEMLTLPDKEIEYVTENTTVSDIRELKHFSAEEEEKKNGEQLSLFKPVETRVMSWEEAVRDFFKDKVSLFNEVQRFSIIGDKFESARRISEEVSPSGTRMHRYGIILMLLQDMNRGITIRKMGQPDEHHTWMEFEKVFVSLGNGMDHMPLHSEIYPQAEPDIVYAVNDTEHEKEEKPSEEAKEPTNGLNTQCEPSFMNKPAETVTEQQETSTNGINTQCEEVSDGQEEKKADETAGKEGEGEGEPSASGGEEAGENKSQSSQEDYEKFLEDSAPYRAEISTILEYRLGKDVAEQIEAGRDITLQYMRRIRNLVIDLKTHMDRVLDMVQELEEKEGFTNDY